MRRLNRFGIVCGLVWLLTGFARGDTFRLDDGQTITGEIVSPDERGTKIRLPEGGYVEIKLTDGTLTQTIPWAKFSQADLKKIAGNPKAAQLVEPFIETPPVERARQPEITVKPVPRLERPTAGSLLSALFSSSVGLAVLFILYLANIYAGYEIALMRAQPVLLVCGLAAIVPLIGPVVFLCLPTRMKFVEGKPAWAAAEQSTAVEAAPAPGAQVPARPAVGLTLAAHEETEVPAIPVTKTFARGEFTFNRRFFETRFPGFFGIIRRDTERDLVLTIKSARGLYVAQRISRMAANDMHIQVQKGLVSEEVIIPFVEIEEVQLKHKSAP